MYWETPQPLNDAVARFLKDVADRWLAARRPPLAGRRRPRDAGQPFFSQPRLQTGTRSRPR